MNFYNTLTRVKEEFKLEGNKEVKLYACGPTVYDYTHIGHFRAYIFVDILARAIRYSGTKLIHVMNITDVGHLTDDQDGGEDKVEIRAQSEKKTVFDIAKFYTDEFFSSMDSLNALRPDIICKATDHIKEMIDLILLIERNGYAYKINDGIYFDTMKLADYGRLARLDQDKLLHGARVEMNPLKKSPTDFALWKFSPKNHARQMEWSSPWGKGFPGWHIECTAMSVKYLGKEIDIHTGGIDHISVHHTNEMAQAWGAFGREIVRFWMHNEFLLVDGEKMSKSKRNFYTLEDIKKREIHPLCVRYFFLQAHYRSPVNFTWEGLQAAQNGFYNLYEKIRSIQTRLKNKMIQNTSLGTQASNQNSKIDEYKDLFARALNDDLNTSQSMAALWGMLDDNDISDAQKLSLAQVFDKVLGLGLVEESESVPPDIDELKKQRDSARTDKDFKKADDLRRQIELKGYIVKDTATGTMVIKKKI